MVIIFFPKVCAFPAQKELFGRPTEFCRRAKKTCHQHFNWEKLRRAEIDMERVRLVRYQFCGSV